MPFHETNKMDQRIEFALKALKTDNFSQLCRDYGISRLTGYKWRDRLLNEGIEQMAEKSRKPHNTPAALDEAVVCEIIRLKQAGAGSEHR